MRLGLGIAMNERIAVFSFTIIECICIRSIYLNMIVEHDC